MTEQTLTRIDLTAAEKALMRDRMSAGARLVQQAQDMANELLMDAARVVLHDRDVFGYVKPIIAEGAIVALEVQEAPSDDVIDESVAATDNEDDVEPRASDGA